MDIIDKWDELSKETNYYYNRVLHKNITISFICDYVFFEMKVFLTEEKKCNIPFYRAPLIATYDAHDILYKEKAIIEDLVNKINDILKPKPSTNEAVFNKDAKPQFCPCCGAPRKRNSMKCEYCEIEFF